MKLNLYSKILLMFLVNVAVLVVIAAAVLRLQFGSGLGTMLGKLASDRIQTVAEGLYLRLSETPLESWDGILEDVAKPHGLQIAVVGAPPAAIAGNPISVPHAIIDEMESIHPARGRSGPQPRHRREDFPAERGLGSLFEERPPPPHEQPEDRALPTRLGAFMKESLLTSARTQAGGVLDRV